MDLRIFRSVISLLFVCFLVLVINGCTRQEQYAGLYILDEGTADIKVVTELELKDNGQGFWRNPDEEVSFRWSARGHEIRLHMKEGGILTGTVGKNILELQLPGKQIVVFRKSPGSA